MQTIQTKAEVSPPYVTSRSGDTSALPITHKYYILFSASIRTVPATNAYSNIPVF